GYILYYGTTSGAGSGRYSNSINVGNGTQWTIPALTDGQRYYFAIKAYDANTQSPFSTETRQIASVAHLTVVSARTGNSTPGQVGASYTLTACNGAGAGHAGGSVAAGATRPAGLIAAAMSGSGWSSRAATGCFTTSGALSAGPRRPAMAPMISPSITAR